MPRSRLGRRLVALAIVGLALGACGKKGPPVAPEARVPAPPSEARAYIDEDAIVVGWTIPRTRADGTALRDLSALKLYRREETEGTLPRPAMLAAGRVAGFDQVVSVSPSAPAPAVVQGDRIEWVDRRPLVPGQRYVYVLTATDSTGRTSAPSDRLTVPYLAAPKAPRGLRASPGDRHVTLSWQAPAELVDGSPASGPFAYVVLRGAGPDGPVEVVAPGVSDTSYVDKGLENDSEYRYVVRAVRTDPRVSAGGPPSSPVTAMPADTTPPRAPTNLVVVPSPGALLLAWTASPDDDVALYAIYRSGGPGGLIRIGTALAGTTAFIDRDVRAGAPYRYAVTAIDRARTPNESARSNEVTATAQ